MTWYGKAVAEAEWSVGGETHRDRTEIAEVPLRHAELNQYNDNSPSNRLV